MPINNHAVLLTATVSPYLMACAAVSMALLLLARRWVLAIVAIGLTMTVIAVQLPMYVRKDSPPPGQVELRIISANLRDGQADAAQLVAIARAGADVLAVQELSPGEVDRLSASGLDATFPYRWLDARQGAQGVGLWSRFPLDAMRRIGGYTFALVSARIRVPGLTTDPSIVVAHLPGPWPQSIDGWRRDMELLPATLHEIAEQTGSGCVIAAADLNATMDMRPFRALLTDGYRDAAEQSGAGIKPTFPADWPLPPFIAIDHVLARGCTATSLRTIEIPGSDHRGIIATVLVPPSSATA